MSPTVNCLRCGKMAALTFTDESGGTMEAEEVDVDGLLTYVCRECMTDEEALLLARQSAAKLLDAAEEALASLEMIFNRIPNVRDDPRFKESYAEAQRHAEQARATLRALLSVDEEGGA